MDRVRAFVTKIFVLASLALGGAPRVVAWLELLQRPGVARVVVSRRRIPDYDDLFAADADEQPADRRGSSAPPERRYRWVESA